MLVLIDESGDPGFKLLQGSSLHFVVGMVIFHDLKEAEKTGLAIKTAQSELRVHPEFKFSKSCDGVRDAFFNVVNSFNFGVRAMVVDKDILYSEFLKRNTESFYNYFVKQLLSHGCFLNNASIKIDGSGDRKFKRQFTKYLRNQLDSSKIKKLKFVKSHSDSLIQLADMVTGAIARPYRYPRENDSDRWKLMIRSKIEDIWQFK